LQYHQRHRIQKNHKKLWCHHPLLLHHLLPL
jgi:hypothetical protein